MSGEHFGEKPLTQKQRYNYHYVLDAMRRFEWDMHHTIAVNARVPDEWHEISVRRERRKTKICFSVDEDVVKWFRSMGPGYQPRMNDVLRAFMHSKLTGLLHGDDTLDAFRDGHVVGLKRPGWGETERDMEEIGRGEDG